MKRPNNLSHFFWLLASLIVGLSWTSCSKEDAPVIDTPTDAGAVASTVTQDQPFLSETEAKTQATDLYAALFPESLRSGTTPKVKSVRLLDPFRSTQDSAGGIYVVNFENDGGYIMMAEHRYGEPILAACPKGNFYPEKALENPNFVPILANMRALVSSSRCPSKPGSCPEVDDEVRIIGYDPWETEEVIPPLIPVKWGQRYPFNLYVPNRETGEVSPVGCVTTAIAQILSYYRYPQHLDWASIISKLYQGGVGKKDMSIIAPVAALHKDIGMLLNIDYSKTSEAYDKDVPRVFNHYGLSCQPNLQAYSWSKVYREFKEKRPVYIGGDAVKKITTTPDRKSPRITFEPGHAWVLDGYKILKRKVKTIQYTWEDPNNPENTRWKPIYSFYYERDYLVHCNLGWNGYNNGYYVSGIFDFRPEGGPDLRSSITEETEGAKYIYQFNLEILTGIKPN